ncbi:MAG: cytochrome c3 family protein [Bacillota bacterium]
MIRVEIDIHAFNREDDSIRWENPQAGLQRSGGPDALDERRSGPALRSDPVWQARRNHVAILFAALICLCLTPSLARAQLSQNLQPNSGKDCAVCHLEWAESFDRPGAILLIDRPEKPAVANSETCLGCHDGSVADSRLRVWHDHGHKTGITPSGGMKVPEQLPLEDGKLACRTCHTAHSAPSGGTLKDLVFLRMRNDQGQLCTACHADQAKGPDAGSHPLGKMPAKLPHALATLGSRAGPDNQQVVCQTCHNAHGAKQDHLLVMQTETSQLCLTCHEQIRPGMWRSGGPHEHPQDPPLHTQAQLKAIKDLGTRTGPNNTMTCFSCHKMHKGQSGRAMLADTLENSQLCIRCHPERQNMANSVHDLRKSAPQEANVKGQTPQQSGPCGACHTFHSYARQRTPQTGDPQGLCTTCHAEDQVASKHTGLPFSHPGDLRQDRIPKDAKLALFPSPNDPAKKVIACLSCHDPHQMKQPHFLRTTGDDLCGSCHNAKVHTFAGAHDFTKNADLKNGRGRTAAETGKCGFCHAVHNANGPAMWVATKNQPASPDALCAECHRADGPAGKHPVAMFNHPIGPKARPTTRPANSALPLFDPKGHQTVDGSVSCASCHDVHQDMKGDKDMLRTATTTELCAQCHPKEAQMAGGLHDPQTHTQPFPGSDQKNTDLCLVCHKPHSNDPQRRQWAVAPKPGLDGPDSLCISCHQNNTWTVPNGSLKVGAIVHPRTIAPDSPIRSINHGLPLRKRLTSSTPGSERSDDPDLSASVKRVAQPGQAPDTLMCKTCHNPHSGSGANHLLRVEPGHPSSQVCESCHDEARHVLKSMHSPQIFDPDKPASHACRPCHATHAIPGSAQKLLWAAKVEPEGATLSEKLCLGCHSPNGTAKAPTVVQHPQTAIKKLTLATSQPSDLQKKVAMIEQITCSTCHVPHGRQIDLPNTQPSAQSPVKTRLSAVKPMLRPDVDRNLCANCHGLDATRNYLYFHNPRKREAMQKYINQ